MTMAAVYLWQILIPVMGKPSTTRPVVTAVPAGSGEPLATGSPGGLHFSTGGLLCKPSKLWDGPSMKSTPRSYGFLFVVTVVVFTSFQNSSMSDKAIREGTVATEASGQPWGQPRRWWAQQRDTRGEASSRLLPLSFPSQQLRFSDLTSRP